MSQHWKADLSILSITIIWGSSFILMKNLLDYTPVFAYLALRFLLASLILCLLFFKRLKNITAGTLKKGIVVGLTLFGGMALQVVGLQYTTASNSGFITGMNVVMVPVLSALYLKKKPPLLAVVGVIAAAAGLFFLSGGTQLQFNLGDLLTLFCAICFTLQIIFIDDAASKEDPVLITIIQVATAALLYTGVWGFQGFALPVVNTTLVTTILWTGAFGTAFAVGVQTVAQKYTTPTRTALIITCEPVFAAIFAWTIPNSQGITEKPGLYTIIGCILILGGMLLSELPKLKVEEVRDAVS
ncbi:MAG: DMT family transporter [Ruminiclostridium sp.]|nr:DMT family transporter [Ruminiclostridium sp.]